MIIDLILDRENGKPYNQSEFYAEVLKFEEPTSDDIDGSELARALETGTNDDVKRELVIYVAVNGYDLEIINYIMSVEWKLAK